MRVVQHHVDRPDLDFRRVSEAATHFFLLNNPTQQLLYHRLNPKVKGEAAAIRYAKCMHARPVQKALESEPALGDVLHDAK